MENLNNHYKINFKEKEYKIPKPKINKLLKDKINKNKNRIYYSHVNNRKLINDINAYNNGNSESLNYNYNYNNSYKNNEEYLFKNKGRRKISNKSIKSNNLKNNNMILPYQYQYQQFEKSFDYSNLLLDNLKNKISKINFQ